MLLTDPLKSLDSGSSPVPGDKSKEPRQHNLEYEAKRYEGRVKDRGILVSVHCDSSDEVSRAKDILKRIGEDDVASSGEKSVSSHTASSERVETYRTKWSSGA